MNAIELTHADTDTQFVRQMLNEYNFRQVPNDRHETLNLVVRQNERIIAGLVGDTYWNWFYISLFWVDENERSRGLGSRILTEAEQIALQRGCRNAHLETHDFQNLEFYQKRGYAVFGKLEGLPQGHTKYYLRKPLVPK
jgi:GNAT superfamily N-acetyltransferase